ncbi:MAG: hypothetical protein ACFFHD_11925, partial [Promethearchaeota archaeon]
SVKDKLVKALTRDVELDRNIFFYLFFSFLAVIFIVEYFIIKCLVHMQKGLSQEIPVILILFLISLIFLSSGFFVDVIKNKTQLYIISLIICLIGLCLSFHPSPIVDLFSVLITIFTIPILIITWFSTLIHETNILNRSRITAIILVSCFLLGLIGLLFVFFKDLFIFFIILEFILLIIIILYSKNYQYTETEERLKSDKKYLKIIFEKHFSRYSISFAILSGLLGGLFYTTLDIFERFEIDIIAFSTISFIYVLAGGWFFDKVGRKTTLVIGILVISFFSITHSSFYQAGMPNIFGIPLNIHISIHYAFSILPLILAIFTISGDFSTERGNLKYRGAINGLFLALMCFGIALGYLFYRLINTNPEIEIWAPNLPNLLNSFALVIVLVWLMAGKEILISKEREWASSIKQLYVLNYNGVCLYYKDFELEQKKKDKDHIDEDLVSGTLSGIVTIVTEITKSKKHLRKIIKENNYFYFSYGKHHIVTLISTLELPVLLKKLDEFSVEFEETFIEDLKNFKGNISRFEPANYLVKKYFEQKQILIGK